MELERAVMTAAIHYIHIGRHTEQSQKAFFTHMSRVGRPVQGCCIFYQPSKLLWQKIRNKRIFWQGNFLDPKLTDEGSRTRKTRTETFQTRTRIFFGSCQPCTCLNVFRSVYGTRFARSSNSTGDQYRVSQLTRTI